MTIMKSILRISVLFLFFPCVACGPLPKAAISDAPSGPGAWIDAPLNNSTIPQAEYQVVSHASDRGGVSAFELKVNGQVVSTDPVEADQAGETIAHISQPWLPPAPGTYLLEVRAANANGDYGPSAFSRVSVGEVPLPILATPGPTQTMTPTPTSSIPLAVGLQDSNCRDGPGSRYEVGGTLRQDQSVEIEGINSERTWVWVKHPNFEGRHCWLSIPFIKVLGSLDGLPVIPAPPLPVTPEPTFTPTPVHH